MRCSRWIAAFVAVTGSGIACGQDTQPGIELPIRARVALELAFNDRMLWFPLEEPELAIGRAENRLLDTEPGFRERWLIRALTERQKGVTAAEAVRKITVRHDGTTRTIATEQGLEVRGSKEGLEAAEKFLGRFRDLSRQSVTLEVRVFSLGTTKNLPESVVTVATRRDLDQRSSELLEQGASELFSPIVIVLAGQTATLATGEELTYIKDYEMEVTAGASVADPIIDTITDGFQMQLTPLIDPDGGATIVSGSVEFSKITRPVREERVKMGAAEVTLQLPERRSCRWKGEVKLEAGADTFRITGLRNPAPGPRDVFEDVEVWCTVSLEQGAPKEVSGEIVDRDEKYRNVFVRWPQGLVPDEPWEKAPKEVTVYKDGKEVGKASLNGGLVVGEPGTESVLAIYHLAEGTPLDADSVR